MRQTERQCCVRPVDWHKSTGERVTDHLGSEELNVTAVRRPDTERLSHGRLPWLSTTGLIPESTAKHVKSRFTNQLSDTSIAGDIRHTDVVCHPIYSPGNSPGAAAPGYLVVVLLEVYQNISCSHRTRRTISP